MDLNLILVVSLAVLAFFSFCTFIVMIPIAWQLFRTLSSAKSLIDTIRDFEDDVKDIRQGIANVKNVVQTSTKSVRSGFEQAMILMKSSVSGIVAGVREYFSNYKSDSTSYNNKHSDKEVIHK